MTRHPYTTPHQRPAAEVAATAMVCVDSGSLRFGREQLSIAGATKQNPWRAGP